MALYQQEYSSPPVRPVPTHVTPFDIDYENPTKGGIGAAVILLRRNSSGSHTHLRAEHLQQLLIEAYSEETYNDPPNPTWWVKLSEIIQSMWDTRSIPTELGCTMLVLITKGNTGTQGIGMLELVWKVL